MSQRSSRGRPSALVLPLVLATASCGGKVIELGQAAPDPYHFGPATLVAGLASSGRGDNPTLTADLLEIYFTTNEDPEGNGDIWSAQRASASEPFGNPVPVGAVNSPDYETSSAVSGDGLTLWFGSARPGGSGGIDIWVSTRTTRSAPWSTPKNLTELNTSADDIPRPPGQHGLVMPMASTLTTPSNQADRNYKTYLTKRRSWGDPFETPVAIPEIDDRYLSVVDGFLSDDGLVLFFTGPAEGVALDAGSALDAGTADADIFVAFRRSRDAPFVVIQPLTDINTSASERDPWISPDGSAFYFTSDRDGTTSIYTATALPR
jgi:hypothetical protein